MTITFVGAGAAATIATNSASVLLAAPAVTDGDLLIAFVGHAAFSGSVNITPPTGWATVAQPVDANGIGAYTKVATAADSQQSFKFVGSYLGGVIVAYRGAASVEAHALNPNNSGFTTSVTAPTVTTTKANDVVVEAVTSEGGGSVTPKTVPATSRVAATGGSNSATGVAVAVADQTQAAAGLSTAQTFTFTGSSYLYALTLALVAADTAPTATITAPAAAAKVNPRNPLTVTWTETDADGDAQTQWEVGVQSSGSSTWTTATGTGTTSSYTIPANTLTDDVDATIRVRLADAVAGWGAYATITVHADSWTYLAEVVGTATTQQLDTTGFATGDYEVEVATADAKNGYGPYSAALTFSLEELSWWDGAAAHPAALLGWWDGTTIQPVSLLGWWDGATIEGLS